MSFLSWPAVLRKAGRIDDDLSKMSDDDVDREVTKSNGFTSSLNVKHPSGDAGKDKRDQPATGAEGKE